MIEYYGISRFDYANAAEEAHISASRGGNWVGIEGMLRRMMATRFGREPVQVKLVRRGAVVAFQFSSRDEMERFTVRWKLHQLDNGTLRRMARLIRRLLWTAGMARV